LRSKAYKAELHHQEYDLNENVNNFTTSVPFNILYHIIHAKRKKDGNERLKIYDLLTCKWSFQELRRRSKLVFLRRIRSRTGKRTLSRKRPEVLYPPKTFHP